jgi:hypothetical protein
MLDLDPTSTNVRTLVSGEMVGTFETPDDNPA